jgi:hypothetical protein
MYVDMLEICTFQRLEKEAVEICHLNVLLPIMATLFVVRLMRSSVFGELDRKADSLAAENAFACFLWSYVNIVVNGAIGQVDSMEELKHKTTAAVVSNT